MLYKVLTACRKQIGQRLFIYISNINFACSIFNQKYFVITKLTSSTAQTNTRPSIPEGQVLYAKL